jgi:DNA polymerase (family 10)
MKNVEIAKVFQDMADLLELKEENKFKIRAYRRAAQVIEHLPQEMAAMLAQEADFHAIPGIGDAIAKKSVELLQTGNLKALEDLKAEFPEGITKLLEIPGIGPKTAQKLSTELHITSIEALEKAISDGKVASLFRLGNKLAENLLQQIQALRRKDQRIPIGIALPVVEEIIDALQDLPGVKNLTAAGSLRRFRETVGDIDLMGTADHPEKIIQAFADLPQVKEIIAHGPTKASVMLHRGFQADLRMVEHDVFGSLLQHFTGSKEHNIALRTKTQKMGLKLSEYGITDLKKDRMEKFLTEEAFYRRLKLQHIPPELREDQGEIELAEKHTLPKLVEMSDIRGDFHVHSDWSDGHASIFEMAEAAGKMGYDYLVITDHSGGLGVARGLDIERLQKQIQIIREINNKRSGAFILCGVELDIRADGSLDLPDEILKELDVVVAAVHSSLKQNKEKMTHRILAAIENPHVDIIAHPTCRLIGTREPISVDMEDVIQAAALHDKVLEINAMPDRLDLKDTHIHRARELGVMMAIGTDAHQTCQLNLMRFGIGMARRGWCEAKHLLNCRQLEEIMALFRK